MNITIVAGARPNFLKIAPIIKSIHSAQIDSFDIHYRLIHTGQHFDNKMSGDFFEQLGIPNPHVNFDCGGGTQAEQTASIMVKFENELKEFKPDVVLVVGDVTSTMACTITAKKMGIDTVHVEAGIRSGDMSMPEEINRIVTDSITDHFFTTSRFANDNLCAMKVDSTRIHFVGNTMIDSLYQNLDRLIQPKFWELFGLKSQQYFLFTLHRPSNVDLPLKLKGILESIIDATAGLPIIFPVHPRTRKVLDFIKIDTKQLIMIEPQAYLEFIYLLKYAKAIITDSGGITEEATVLHVPCLTMRNSTERPETVIHGTNKLIGDNLSSLAENISIIKNGNWKIGEVPEKWDGHTSQRIVNVLLSLYEKKSIMASAL
jgi:UDP-N-acetylglucosamine 2-epimerase (non-hydrolysing)